MKFKLEKTDSRVVHTIVAECPKCESKHGFGTDEVLECIRDGGFCIVCKCGFNQLITDENEITGVIK